jgi:uncharacterized protein YndB with AHSA1/START domain
MDDRYTLTVEREIPGPIDAVFDAWLEAATMVRWMTPAPDISVEAASDPVVGGRFRVVMKGRGQEIVHTGEYLVIERPTRLVFTWQSEPAGDTLVAVDFTRVGDRRTLVTLTHERFPTAEQRDLHRGGWTALLETLARVMTEMKAR